MVPLDLDGLHYYRVKPASWRNRQEWLDQIQRGLEEQPHLLGAGESRAIILVVTDRDENGQLSILGDGPLYFSEGAWTALRALMLESDAEIQPEALTLAQLPQPLQVRVGHPDDHKKWQARGALGAGMLPAPEPARLELFEVEPPARELPARIELLLTCFYDTVLLVGVVGVRNLGLWTMHVLTPADNSDWITLGLELVFDFGLLVTAIVIVVFDLLKRLRNAWRSLAKGD